MVAYREDFKKINEILLLLLIGFYGGYVGAALAVEFSCSPPWCKQQTKIGIESASLPISENFESSGFLCQVTCVVIL